MVTRIYRRTLPHWQPEGASIFLTWRLYGSLPKVAREPVWPIAADKSKASPGKQFKLIDVALDKADDGPLWLADPRIALCVTTAIQTGANPLGFYNLHAFVVMPNHVHVLVTPKVSLARMTNGLKGVSARESNRILERTGKPFWQYESFDHWVRNPAEFEKIRGYIEANPVSAGLVAIPEAWPWSSATKLATTTVERPIPAVPPHVK